MNRIDRLSAILIQLQSRKTVKAQHIAERFDISLRTVYRDVKSLEEAGIPIIGEAGIGYSLLESYRLPPIMFTLEEAMAFITAEKLVEKLTDAANSSQYQSAMFKVKAVLRTAEKEYINSMDNHIEVLKAKRPPHIKADVNPLQTILKATNEKKLLNLKYFVQIRQENTQRCVEPLGIFYLDNYWHLIAWCRTRNDYRDFRFDRITALTLTEQQFDDKHPSLKTYLKNYCKDEKLTEITIRVTTQAAKYLGEQKYYHGYAVEKEIEKDGWIEMCFLTASIEGFIRWFMMYADEAQIISPEIVKERVRVIVKKISENLHVAQ
jgi:predicted DNA-binding transcriptional regulator YafY